MLRTCVDRSSSFASFSGRAVPRAPRHNATATGQADRVLQPVYTAADLDAVRARAGGQVDHAVLAAGCFWKTEEVYMKVPGVLDVLSGYTGGQKENPTYQVRKVSRRQSTTVRLGPH